MRTEIHRGIKLQYFGNCIVKWTEKKGGGKCGKDTKKN